MSESRSRPAWSMAAGIVVGAALLILALRQVDWTAVARALREVAPLWLAAAVLLSALAHALFAARWHVIAGRAHQLTFGDAFDFLAIGALAGLVLPPRLSDVARAVAAGRYRATSSTGLFGTIVVERLADVLMLVLFGAAVSALMAVPQFLLGALVTLLAIVAAAVGVLWMGAEGPIGAIVRVVARWRGARSRVPAVADRFLSGTGVIREREAMPAALVFSLLGWAAAAACAYAIMRAFGIGAPWYAGAFTIVIINLAGLLPAPPAGLGVYHYAAMVGVSPWLPDSSRAFAFALASHAVSVAVVIMLGTWSLARKGLSLRTLRRLAAEQSGPSA